MANDAWFENTQKLAVADIVGLEHQFRIDSLISAIEAVCLEKDDRDDADISEGELTVLAVEAMQREVNNGGFAQFFQNSSCRFTPYLSAALSSIGATETQAIVDAAVDVLGVGPLTPSTDALGYFTRMQTAVEEEHISSDLEELDAKFYDCGEDIAGLLFQYVKANLGDFA